MSFRLFRSIYFIHSLLNTTTVHENVHYTRMYLVFSKQKDVMELLHQIFGNSIRFFNNKFSIKLGIQLEKSLRFLSLHGRYFCGFVT